MQSRLTAVAVLLGLAASAGRSQPYVEDSINVFNTWVGSLCYNSASDVIYAASENGVVFAISCSQNQLISMIFVDGRAFRLTYSATSNKAYASVFNDYIDSVLVIDGAAHERLKMIPLLWATELVWDSVDNRVWVSCQGTNEVACIDCATDSVIARVAVGDCPLKLYVNTRHRKLYVLNNDGESVSIVSLVNGQVIRTIPLGNVPDAGCYSVSADKFYCGAGCVVSVVDGSNDSVTGYIQIPLGSSATTMAEVPAAGLMMLGIYGGGNSAVYSVNTNTDSIVSRVNVGREASSLLWCPESRLVYCAGTVTDDVSAIADDGSRVETTLGVGDAPFVLAYSTTSARLYVGHLNSRKVYVIRDSAPGITGPAAPLRARRGRLRVAPMLTRTGSVHIHAASPIEAVAVLSLDGRLVRELRPKPDDDGVTAVWDGKDALGRRVPSGVYVVSSPVTGDHATVIKLK
jgi:YVTN family beta-propeller protein